MTDLTPIDPASARPARSRTGQPFTPDRMADFLTSLRTMGNVATACRRAGISRQTAYRTRRVHPGFARAWDAAVVAARTVAESELADRAIYGTEEKVFYHGEEIGSRRRHDARLLLAHLARLDKAAERLDVAAALPQLDGWIAALAEGGAVEAVLPDTLDPHALLAAQEARDLVADPRATLAAQASRGEAQAAGTVPRQDCVTPVTPAHHRSPAIAREPDALPPLERRLQAMEAALPRGLEDDIPPGWREHWLRADEERMRAFEAGAHGWWLAGLCDSALEGVLDACPQARPVAAAAGRSAPAGSPADPSASLRNGEDQHAVDQRHQVDEGQQSDRDAAALGEEQPDHGRDDEEDQQVRQPEPGVLLHRGSGGGLLRAGVEDHHGKGAEDVDADHPAHDEALLQPEPGVEVGPVGRLVRESEAGDEVVPPDRQQDAQHGAAIEGHDGAIAVHVDEEGGLVDDDEQPQQRHEPADADRGGTGVDARLAPAAQLQHAGKAAQHLRHGETHEEDERLEQEVEPRHADPLP